MKNRIQYTKCSAQVMYDLSSLGCVSGEDLRDFFKSRGLGLSPSGKIRVNAYAAAELLHDVAEAMFKNGYGIGNPVFNITPKSVEEIVEILLDRNEEYEDVS